MYVSRCVLLQLCSFAWMYVYMCVGVQLSTCPSVYVSKSAPVQVFACAGEHVCTCTDVYLCKCVHISLQVCSHLAHGRWATVTSLAYHVQCAWWGAASRMGGALPSHIKRPLSLLRGERTVIEDTRLYHTIQRQQYHTLLYNTLHYCATQCKQQYSTVH